MAKKKKTITVLEDIQRDPSKFTVGFWMRQAIAGIAVQIVTNDELYNHIKMLADAEYKPEDFKLDVIGLGFGEYVSSMLDSTFNYD